MVNISPEQLKLLTDRDFLIEKKRISRQLIQYLADTERCLKEIIEDSEFQFPNTAFTKAGKISKGDSYRDLPYFVLDYPRLFTKTDVFAFRTMIRWGHEISCTLHLAGRYKTQYETVIINEKSRLADNFLCINESPWEYHYEESNYQLISKLKVEEFESILKKPFLKISQPFPLTSINELSNLANASFRFYLEILSV